MVWLAAHRSSVRPLWEEVPAAASVASPVLDTGPFYKAAGLGREWRFVENFCTLPDDLFSGALSLPQTCIAPGADSGYTGDMACDRLAELYARAAACGYVHSRGSRTGRRERFVFCALPGAGAAGCGNAHPCAFSTAGHWLWHRLRGHWGPAHCDCPVQAYGIGAVHHFCFAGLATQSSGRSWP